MVRVEVRVVAIWGTRGEGRGNMGYTYGRNFGNRPPRNAYEESRQKHINSVDWKKFNKMYDKALEDMERDIATEGLIAMSPAERRMNLVSSAISRIRVENNGHDENENEDQGEDVDNTTHTRNDHESGGIDVVSQLIAIRRLSLLFSDNFDFLEMEEMGRLWETMVIVLTPERRTSRRNHDDDPVVGTPHSRLERLKRERENGFKFAFHSVETDEVGANGDEDGDGEGADDDDDDNTDGEDIKLIKRTK